MHDRPFLIDLIFLIAFLGILVLFIGRLSRKRKSRSNHGAIKRREIQKVNKGAVIVPTSDNRSSVHWQKYKEGNRLIDAEKMDDAIVIFRQLVTIPGEEETANVNLGTCYNLKNERETAMTHYQAALNLNPNNYNALLGMASVNYRTGHYPTAVVYYKKANALKPELPDAYWGLAVAYNMMNEKELSSDNAKTFIKMVPDSRYRPNLEKMII
ncbi:MAG: tetratricopeptide repeat protein [Bacteroidia bacterium]